MSDLEIKSVEFKCNKCGAWEVNEMGMIFLHPTLCKKCMPKHKEVEPHPLSFYSNI